MDEAKDEEPAGCLVVPVGAHHLRHPKGEQRYPCEGLVLLEITHYELQKKVISVQSQQNEDRKHTRVVSRCGILSLPGSRSSQFRPLGGASSARPMSPTVIQVEASPRLGHEKQDRRVLVGRIQILG